MPRQALTLLSVCLPKHLLSNGVLLCAGRLTGIATTTRARPLSFPPSTARSQNRLALQLASATLCAECVHELSPLAVAHALVLAKEHQVPLNQLCKLVPQALPPCACCAPPRHQHRHRHQRQRAHHVLCNETVKKCRRDVRLRCAGTEIVTSDSLRAQCRLHPCMWGLVPYCESMRHKCVCCLEQPHELACTSSLSRQCPHFDAVLVFRRAGRMTWGQCSILCP